MESSNELTKVDKAAILLLAVGQDKAAEVLTHLNAKEVQIVGATMAGLGVVDADTIDSVLEEFILSVRSQTGVGVDSNQYIRGMLNTALGEEEASTMIDRILLGKHSKGIEQLKWMDARSITDLVRLEHPQIVAIILSLLEPDMSGEVLSMLPEMMRADLLMRVATLDGVQPAALRELDAIMEKQLIGGEDSQASTIGGVEAAASMLNFVDGTLTESIVEGVTKVDAELSEEIQEKMFIFSDLIEVDDRGIQALLREITTDQLLLALRSATDALKEKIFSNMSKRAADMLRDDLEAAPPTKLSEVEQAQKDILAVAKKLADAGEIVLGGGSADELV